ncbi:mitogen-activated protein kinase kinase kinase 14 isoform X1 [Sphaeramia orbicularis]|uniref:Mitogen-activated protein kinase kinase kinase 14-like n=1 Tax=Sphaeramia orbicularis TaxID=375764 RepID=A0A672YUN0_9TELE|nr:mitogen-activated protein kinase kinase kinase 14-like isoform X1 [Sphaeramia orbicularis]XP_030018890.1 mitogen-activated protein kinase kinase kinase 14-like isoform X1 [Sphaeramia orbicularis]
MAIPRMFNSNTPFVIVTGGTELSFLGKDDSQGCEEEKDSLAQAIAPHLSRVMQHGTAKHVGTVGPDAPGDNPPVSIVAQAEREDFQEFSPSNTQCPYSRSQILRKNRSLIQETVLQSDTDDEDMTVGLPHHHLQRKQRRKTRRRPSKEEGEHRPIIQGLWVQEIDWLRSASRDMTLSDRIIPPPPQFTDSVSPPYIQRRSMKEDPDVCNCVSASEAVSPSEDQYTVTDPHDTSSSVNVGDSDSDCGLEQDSESICNPESDSDSSCCVEDCTQTLHKFGAGATTDSTFDLMGVSGFSSELHSSCWGVSDPSDSIPGAPGCAQSLLGTSTSTHSPSTLNASQCDSGRGDLSDIDTVVDGLRGRVTHMPKLFGSPFFKDLMRRPLSTKPISEGLIFHNRLQPTSSQYREGQEYCILHHIQNGSYGDVFCIQDKRTGFECAAKRIPLSHFSCEEVSTWSAQDSPRVVELFGAVREGPNVMLFMDLKPACLAQLLKEMNTLPEDLALHYLHQTLGALEHLHNRKVLHLDVKVDNVLLSADCTDTFLCDFGLSETLDDNGWSTKAFRGSAFPGTETHMAPEVAQGDQLCAKVDVWSSCCMLLHMLNGCQPWIRYYSHPLCLQIVNEPPPLWEVPSNCNNFTAKVFRAGLQKDPDRRASAKELRRKTTKALRAVGGLSPWSIKSACEKLCNLKNHNEDTPSSLSPEIPFTQSKPPAAVPAPTMYWVSPWRTMAVDEDNQDSEWASGSDQDSYVETDSLTREWECQPKSLHDDNEKHWDTGSDSDVDIYMGEEEFIQEKWLKNDRDYEGDWEEDEDIEEEEEGEEWESSVSNTGYFHALKDFFPVLQKGQHTCDDSWGSEAELEYLRDDIGVGNVIQTPSPEPRDDPPSCFSCSESSQIDASEKDSDHSSDDLSSGVFSSCNSQADVHLEWMASPTQPSSHCFEGVDIWIENIQGQCLRIREHREVKVGHVAIGISDQISGKAFTLETLDRKMVSFEHEIKESCLWLRCVPAPDRCQRWTWRVRDGKLELRE